MPDVGACFPGGVPRDELSESRSGHLHVVPIVLQQRSQTVGLLRQGATCELGALADGHVEYVVRHDLLEVEGRLTEYAEGILPVGGVIDSRDEFWTECDGASDTLDDPQALLRPEPVSFWVLCHVVHRNHSFADAGRCRSAGVRGCPATLDLGATDAEHDPSRSGKLPRVSDRGGFHQKPGVWTTPDGPNVRYTIRLHVHGEDRDELGGVRAVDRTVDLRVVTPLGEHTAAVVAADVLRRREPHSVFDKVELIGSEADFESEAADIWDDAATAR